MAWHELGILAADPTAVAEPAWPREETRDLPLSHGIAVYPFLWSQEAQHDLAATTRSPAPLTKLFSLQAEFAARFAAEPHTSTVHIRTM